VSVNASGGGGRGKGLLLALAAVVVIAAIAVVASMTLLKSEPPDLATNAPSIPGLAPGAKVAAVVAPPSGVFHYTVGKGSKAKYVAREQLAVVPVPNETSGETADITGDLYLTRDGKPGDQKSAFKVDLRTLRSDQSLRDRAIVGTLALDKFPFASFTLESVEGFPPNYVEGREIELTLKGALTIRETTKPVTWKAFARRAGEYLTAIADTDVKMTDYGITPPVVSVSRVEDGVHLQITLIGKLGN